MGNISSSITDIIYLTREQDLALVDLWERTRKRDVNGKYGIPADLFFAKTLPLHNFELVLDERNSDIEDGKVTSASFYIADHDIEGLPIEMLGKYTMHEDSRVVMAVKLRMGDTEFLVFQAIEEGVDYLMMCKAFIYYGGEWRVLDVEWVNRFQLVQLVSAYLETWYGIEIALLHPTVKNVFTHPQKVKEKIKKSERGENNFKVYRYVKHHHINTEELNEAIYGKNHSFNRKALIWYVTGHWREYQKTGKRVFIQPYWKGALRETKKAEPRTREIITPTTI